MKPFQLQNKPARQSTAPPSKYKQGVLFAGMACLAGQLDLFPTDGQEVTPPDETAVPSGGLGGTCENQPPRKG